MVKPKASINRSWMVYAFTAGVWLLVSMLMTPVLMRAVAPRAPMSLRFIWGVVILFLNWFWLGGAHHIVSFCVKLALSEDDEMGGSPETDQKARTAVLYLTCDDFDENCAQSCFRGTTPETHIFICDDSRSQDIQAAIDRFQLRHMGMCTILRRADRKGFKAGNINHALRRLDKSFTHVVLLDSDSVLAPNLIPVALGIFATDKLLAFVQSVQYASPPVTTFATDLSFGFDELWKYIALKNRFGFVPCFGHGVVVRRDLLEMIGGVPEVVSEDLMMAVKLAELGYTGRVTSAAMCAESIPLSLTQYRRRFEKWLIGLVESRRSLLASISDSRNGLTILQRIDLSFSCLSLFGIVPFVVYVLSMNVLLPMLFGVWQPLGSVGSLHVYSLSLMPLVNSAATASPFLRALALILTFSPLIYLARISASHPLRSLRYIAVSYTCLCTLLAPAVSSLVAYALSGRAWFRPTYSVEEAGTRPLSLWARFQVGRDLSILLEIAWVSTLFVVSTATLNIFLMSLAVGGLAGPCSRLMSWDGKTMRLLKYAPFALVIVQFLVMCFPAVTAAGALNQLPLVHF